jgi:rhodanese-related sulfurtransferase
LGLVLARRPPYLYGLRPIPGCGREEDDIMLKKGFKQLLAEANAVIDGISVPSALGLQDDQEVVFVDIREGSERAQGHIPGDVHAPRGHLEFLADPEFPRHNAALVQDKMLVLYCATGGRSTLAAKTLHDMGFPRACSLVGGMAAWKAADGPTEA